MLSRATQGCEVDREESEESGDDETEESRSSNGKEQENSIHQAGFAKNAIEEGIYKERIAGGEGEAHAQVLGSNCHQHFNDHIGQQDSQDHISRRSSRKR